MMLDLTYTYIAESLGNFSVLKKMLITQKKSCLKETDSVMRFSTYDFFVLNGFFWSPEIVLLFLNFLKVYIRPKTKLSGVGDTWESMVKILKACNSSCMTKLSKNSLQVNSRCTYVHRGHRG